MEVPILVPPQISGQLWARYVSSLGLSFPIYKMERMFLSTTEKVTNTLASQTSNLHMAISMSRLFSGGWFVLEEGDDQTSKIPDNNLGRGAPGTPHCHQGPSLRLCDSGFVDPGKKKPEAQGLGSGFY